MVVLTTSRAEEDVFRTYDLGVNSFITKPVTFAGLVEVVQSLLALLVRDRRPARRRPTRCPAAPERLAVLLVEDDEDDFVITRDLLAGAEPHPLRARLGRRATRTRARAIEERRHDVYLIDYRLGARTGLDLVREAFAGEHARR